MNVPNSMDCDGPACGTQNQCYTDSTMANLTVTIDDELLRMARVRALQQGTSVNALLRDYLVAYAGSDDLQDRALRDLLELSGSAASRRGDVTWSRDDLHDRDAEERGRRA